MIINYCDELGTVSVKVDQYGIDFQGETAYFSDEAGKDYRVSIHAIQSINAA